jgi:hypothetical protein
MGKHYGHLDDDLGLYVPEHTVGGSPAILPTNKASKVAIPSNGEFVKIRRTSRIDPQPLQWTKKSHFKTSIQGTSYYRTCRVVSDLCGIKSG